MAFPTSVNDQITDSVTQSNVEVVANASATALGGLHQVFAASLALAVKNAASCQQNANAINQAVTTSCVSLILGSKTTNKNNPK